MVFMGLFTASFVQLLLERLSDVLVPEQSSVTHVKKPTVTSGSVWMTSAIGIIWLAV